MTQNPEVKDKLKRRFFDKLVLGQTTYLFGHIFKNLFNFTTSVSRYWRSQLYSLLIIYIEKYIIQQQL